MAYPEKFREAVLLKLAQGYSIREVANLFNINKNTVQKWKDCPVPKKRAVKNLKIKEDELLMDMLEYPNAYNYERAARLNCSISGIRSAIKRLPWTSPRRKNKNSTR